MILRSVESISTDMKCIRRRQACYVSKGAQLQPLECLRLAVDKSVP